MDPEELDISPIELGYLLALLHERKRAGDDPLAAGLWNKLCRAANEMGAEGFEKYAAADELPPEGAF